MLPFTVHFRSGVPPYEELVFAVKKAVVLRQLKPGDPFPSVRKLSQELSLNPNTCQKAVAALTAAGLLEVRPGVGTVVCERPVLSPKERSAALREAIEALVVESRQMGITLSELHEAISEHWKSLGE